MLWPRLSMASYNDVKSPGNDGRPYYLWVRLSSYQKAHKHMYSGCGKYSWPPVEFLIYLGIWLMVFCEYNSE